MVFNTEIGLVVSQLARVDQHKGILHNSKRPSDNRVVGFEKVKDFRYFVIAVNLDLEEVFCVDHAHRLYSEGIVQDKHRNVKLLSGHCVLSVLSKRDFHALSKHRWQLLRSNDAAFSLARVTICLGPYLA